MTKNYLENNQIKTDELGRIIIEDLNLLEQINGAIAGGPEFVLSDGACGNSNCVC
jgi:hypothetical protein